jgi:hypothetical protein
LAAPGKIAHEAAGERVPRAGWVVWFFRNAGTEKLPFLSTIIAPYSPRFTTSVEGPSLKDMLARGAKQIMFV